MTASHPSRWFYGGYIERVEWTIDEPRKLPAWGGRTVEVEKGDTLLVLCTGQPVSEFVGVERREAEVC